MLIRKLIWLLVWIIVVPFIRAVEPSRSEWADAFLERCGIEDFPAESKSVRRVTSKLWSDWAKERILRDDMKEASPELKSEVARIWDLLVLRKNVSFVPITRPEHIAINDQVKGAVQRFGDHPVLNYLGARSTHYSFSQFDKLALLEAFMATDGYRNSSALFRYLVLSQAEEAAIRADLRQKTFDASQVKVMAEILADDSWADDEIAEIWMGMLVDFIGSVGLQYYDQLEKIYRSAKVPEWVKQTLLCRLEASRAWQARGKGFSNTVTPEGARGFARHMKMAEEHGARAYSLNPESVYPARSMLRIAGPYDLELSLWEWFKRVVRVQVDEPVAYNTLILHHLPRWGGSLDEVLAIGIAAVRTGRYDSSAPFSCWQAVRSVVREDSNWKPRLRGTPLGAILIEMGQGYVDEASDDLEKFHYNSMLTLYAYLAGDYIRAAKALDAAGGKVHAAVNSELSVLGLDSDVMVADIQLRREGLAEPFTEATNAWKNRSYDEGMELAQSIADVFDEVPLTLQHLIAQLDVESRLAKGEEVDLLIKPGLPGWMQDRGVLEERDGKIVTFGLNSNTAFFHRARVGSEFEMSFDFSVKTSSSTNHFMGAAFMFNAHPRAGDIGMNALTYNAVGVIRLPRRKCGPYFFTNSNLPQPLLPTGGDVVPGRTYHMRMSCRNGLVSLYFSGYKGGKVPLIEEKKPTVGEGYRGTILSDEDGLVGFGEKWGIPENEVSFWNIKVKRLDFETTGSSRPKE